MVKINNKQKTVFVCLIVGFCLVITIFLINNVFLKNKKPFYLLIDDYTLLVRKNGVWSNQSDNMNVSKEKFAVYFNGKYKGPYYLQYNNKWFVYDENDRVINKDGPLLAYNGGKRLEVINFVNPKVNNEDYERINEAILELGYKEYNEVVVFDKLSFDIDRDRKEETLYAVSNVYSSKEEEMYYSIVFLVDNDKIVIINSDFNTDPYSTATFELSYLIDIDKNKKYEIVVMKDYFSNPDSTCHSLYKYNKEIIELVGC